MANTSVSVGARIGPRHWHHDRAVLRLPGGTAGILATGMSCAQLPRGQEPRQVLGEIEIHVDRFLAPKAVMVAFFEVVGDVSVPAERRRIEVSVEDSVEDIVPYQLDNVIVVSCQNVEEVEGLAVIDHVRMVAASTTMTTGEELANQLYQAIHDAQATSTSSKS